MKEGRSRNVSTWMCKAGNDPYGNGIAVGRHDDRDCRCGTPGGRDSRCVCHDDIDVQPNQFGGMTGQQIITVRITKFNLEVLAFHVAKIAKTGQKCVSSRMLYRSRKPEVSQPNHPGYLLC